MNPANWPPRTATFRECVAVLFNVPFYFLPESWKGPTVRDVDEKADEQ